MQKIFILPLLILLITASAYAEVAFPLRVSDDGRRFVDSNNQPFFVVADSAWSIFSGVSKEDVITYLDDRKAKGFNTVLTSALHFWKDGKSDWKPQHAYYKFWAFDGDHYNLTQPNPNYWDHVEWVIQEAQKRDMLLMICPCWFRWNGDAWYLHLNKNNAQPFAAFLGNRYKQYGNIAWLLGGDHKPEKQLENIKIMGRTLKRLAPNQLISYHSNGLSHGTRQWFEGEDWFDFSTFQTHVELHPQEYTDLIADYDKQPVMPTWNGEPRYEGMQGGVPFAMRQQAYRCAFNGGLGVSYGAGNLFNMGFTDVDWKHDILPYLGASDMQFVKAIFDKLDWTKLAPHHKRPFLAGKQGVKDRYIPAASANDGSWAVAYLPGSGPTGISSIRIDASQLKQPISAWWFDPSDGSYIKIETAQTTKGVLTFLPPGLNQSGDADWVLVISSSAN
ncbi:glycoside hydrolase family 140 protein [bacterium]|nr:glycoside hydrolase family 140 protein [bacterium]